MDFKKLHLSLLDPNTGQIPGLPANPRAWTEQEKKRLAESMKGTPELVEARGCIVVPFEGRYVVLGGNLRLAAAKYLKWPDIMCVVIPEGTPVAKLKEIVLKDNSSFGSWDLDMLRDAWSDVDFGSWGIKVDWDTAGPLLKKDVIEDDFDEDMEEIECRVKLGDIWALGDHRLMCGDSTSTAEVKRQMGDAMADLWLTDPPYNVGYGMEDSVMMSKRKHRTDGLIVLNDRQEDGQFREFLKNAYRAAIEVMKPGAAFYIWHADNEGYNFRGAVRDTKGMKLSECLIWVKDSLCLGRNDYHWRHEPCLYGWKEGEGHSWYSDRKQTTCIEMQRPRKSEEHPTMKPVALFGYQMQNSTKSGDVVLDSFGGSGTTMIAAEQCKRKAMLMELDPHYCDVIIARWEKFTGLEAKKIE